MIILGIDPGTTRIGIGVVEKKNGKLRYVYGGLLDSGNSEKDAERLLGIERGLKKLIKKIKPERVGVEKLFFSKNKKTALAVGQARGVIIKVLAEHKLSFVEVSPVDAKIAVTGSGNAEKKVVARMVGVLLEKDFKGVLDDTTDALAIAIAASQKTLEEVAFGS